MTLSAIPRTTVKHLHTYIMRSILFTILLATPAVMLSAQSTEGGISSDMLQQIRKSNPVTASDRALRNALAGTSINQLATSAENPDATDTYFSNEVPSKGITDQKSSGRCWLFTGLNVMRAEMIKKYDLGEFQFSQNYCFFYDQLEKSNLFLQAVIDNAKKPMDDKLVDWLFQNPLSDGGTFCGVIDVVSKYGLVPSDVMPESFNANNTSRMASIISTKLREYGLTLRKAVADGEIDYQNFVIFDKDDTGHITALRSNVAEVNRMQGRIADEILARLAEVSTSELEIPLGTLTGSALLAGRGPSLHVRMQAVGSASASPSA